MRLKGKTAIVTGGAGGIGKAIAHRYAEEGATVVVTDRSRERADRVAAEVGNGAFGVALDVSSDTSIAGLIPTATANGHTIDILVNNAAVFDMAPVLEVTGTSYDLLFNVNVKGLFFTMQTVAAHMVERGTRGKIINISSQAGRRGAGVDLLRHQGGRHQHDPVRRARSHPLRHQRERHCAGSDRHGDVGPCRQALRPLREPADRREEAAGRGGSAVRTHGRTG
jgi:NAD(P)-dependent dehydrogenase (short-subunit alcohol dehydrogenase family)